MCIKSIVQLLLLVCVLCANLTLGRICEDSSGSIFSKTTFCLDDQYCCGYNNLQCCSQSDTMSHSNDAIAELFSALVAFALVFFCCICCYRCCCRRTASSGTVYSPASTTAVSVCLPPQQGGGIVQQPYPTAAPYPQQTSYPMPTPYQPQPATNPYINMPPPPYHTVVQDGFQHAPPPSAPHFPN